MRQKDKVDSWQLVEFERGRGQSFGTDGESRQSNPDAREKDGVGENLYSEKIDEHSRVTDPGRRYLRIIPLRRFRFGKSRGNRAPAFHRPFTPKMAKPATNTRTAQSWLVSRFHQMNQEPEKAGKTKFPLVTRSAFELGAARMSLTDQPTRGITFSGELNNPLRAFQRVLAALGGPARATSTGQFARFKMLRVRSPMM